jgi:hypothetical protein
MKRGIQVFKKYKSKPKEVQAVQFTEQNKNQVFNSLTGQYAPDRENGKPIIKVTTIHGDTAIVRLGDWIVKEASEGFYYPVAGDVFPASYEIDLDT